MVTILNEYPDGFEFQAVDKELGVTLLGRVSRLQEKETGIVGYIQMIVDSFGIQRKIPYCRVLFTSPTYRSTMLELIKNDVEVQFNNHWWYAVFSEVQAYVLDKILTPVQPSRLKLVKNISADFIYEPIILSGFSTIWYGPGAVGKSFLALTAAVCVQNNLSFLNKVNQQCNVLYLDWETDEIEMGRRLNMIVDHLKFLNIADSDLIPPLYFRATRPFQDIVRDIVEGAIKNDVKLVIIDSLGVACGGALDPESALGFFKAVRMLTEYDVAVLALTHVSKHEKLGSEIKSPIGSAYFEYYPRMIWEITGESLVNSDDIKIGMFCRKSNVGKFDPQGYILSFNPFQISKLNDLDSIEALDTRSTNTNLIKEVLAEGPATVEELAKKTGLKRDSVRVLLNRLKVRGEVKKTDSDTWELETDEVPF